MNIVHVTHNNRAGKSMLGVERHVLTLALAQEARGSTVTVVVNQPGVFSEACDRHGLSLVVVENLKQDSLRALFKSIGAEVVHCHMPLAATRAIPVGNQLHIPCVLTLHTNALAQGNAEAAALLNDAKSAGLRFATVSVSKRSFKAIEQQRFLGADHYYVSNCTKSIETGNTPLGESKDISPAHYPNFILVGSVTMTKGVDIAVLAMADMRRRYGHDCPVLNIYGDGDKMDYIKEMIAVLSLTDVVRMHGFKLDILENCPHTDILLMPSRSETGPLVVLEAMSRGMPIVATDVGEVREWLPDRRYGRVARTYSIVALADAMESILTDVSNGQFDPGLLIERHRSCYTPEIMAQRIDEVYRQAILSESSVMTADARG